MKSTLLATVALTVISPALPLPQTMRRLKTCRARQLREMRWKKTRVR